MDIEFFRPILMELNFPENKQDMILKYVENHINYEINAPFVAADKINDFITTLPMAIKLLSKLDLDKTYITFNPVQTKQYLVKFNYCIDDYIHSKDVEAAFATGMVNESLDLINKYLLNNNKIIIYLLFMNVKHDKFNYNLSFNHKFFIQ